jgi:hypothetical protein
MQEQLAGTVRIVGTDSVGELVRRDVHTVEPHLAVDHAGVRIRDLQVPEPEHLHLAAVQHDARLDRVENGVVVPGLAIRGNGG